MSPTRVRIALVSAVVFVGVTLLVAGELALGGAVLAATPAVMLGVGWLMERKKPRKPPGSAY